MTVSIHDLYSHRNEIADWAIAKGAIWNTPDEMRNAATNEEVFKVLLANYKWVADKGFSCPELDRLKYTDLSPWYVWLLESYCLGHGVDYVVVPVINLHKRVIAGEHVAASEWVTARHSAGTVASTAAMYAASTAARDAAWAAARDADRDAAWYAARCIATDSAWAAAWGTSNAAKHSATVSKLYYYITR